MNENVEDFYLNADIQLSHKSFLISQLIKEAEKTLIKLRIVNKWVISENDSFNVDEDLYLNLHQFHKSFLIHKK